VGAIFYGHIRQPAHCAAFSVADEVTPTTQQLGDSGRGGANPEMLRHKSFVQRQMATGSI
jgi:hypothetical protein